MKKTISFYFVISCMMLTLTSCISLIQQMIGANKYVEQDIINNTNCSFLIPDTSINAFTLNDIKSELGIQKGLNKMSEDVFYFDSANGNETLILEKDPINRFKFHKLVLKNSSEKTYGSHKRLEVNNFITSTGIGLGIDHNQLTAILGTCNRIHIGKLGLTKYYYEINPPNDTPDGYLRRHGFNAYSGVYQFCDDKLCKIEIGYSNK